MTPLRFIFCFLLCFSNITQAINLPFANLQETQLTIPNTLGDKNFGSSLKVTNTIAAITAMHNSSTRTGSVYLYDPLKNWQLITELTSQVTDDNFGKHIALTDDTLIVSAERDNNQQGAVYVFERDLTDPQQWQQRAKLTAPDAQDGSQFGRAVSLVDDKIYIGAPLHQQGKVYIFSRDENSQWQFETSLIPEDSQALRFGEAIAKAGNTLVIGAPFTNATPSVVNPNKSKQPRFTFSKDAILDPGIENGAMFVYEINDNTWSYHSRINAKNGESGDHFGEQIEISIQNNKIISSVKQKDIFDDLRSGAVYIYKKQDDNWIEDPLLLAKSPKIGGLFGQSVALSENYILVGASKSNLFGFNSGEVEIFSQNKAETWESITWQHPQQLESHEQFGLSVAAAENYFLVASKTRIRIFQKTAIQHLSANFYPQNNILALNEVYVADAGVFRADFKLTQQDDDLLLTLVQADLRTDKQTSEIHYSKQTGVLTIPQLAVKESDNKLVFYSLTLQEIVNATPLQFRVSSLQIINPL